MNELIGVFGLFGGLISLLFIGAYVILMFLIPFFIYGILQRIKQVEKSMVILSFSAQSMDRNMASMKRIMTGESQPHDEALPPTQ